jgi:hypothetical protein
VGGTQPSNVQHNVLYVALEFQIERGDALTVGDQADLDDPAVVDDEVEDRKWPPARRPDEPGGAGDGCVLRRLGAADEGLRDGLVAENFRHQRRRPEAGPGDAGRNRRRVGAQDDAGIEQREQCGKVSVAGRGEEGVDDFALPQRSASGDAGAP